MAKPTVGRIVHYISRGSADGYFKPEERAAIIVEVEGVPLDPEFPNDHEEDDYSVTLMVCNPAGIFFDQNVIFSPQAKPGTWTWPERH